MEFKLQAKYKPTGDQPKAINELSASLKKGNRDQTLLGVTGSGKTFVMANLIEKFQRPTLIISHNKTLAAQLASEFREFFPTNEIHYFVSYYDYYLPESYTPRSDTYIEKQTQINEEIERLRHASTQALLSKRDVIIVASVSCIYGLGSPKKYFEDGLALSKGQNLNRQEFLRNLIAIQYQRNDLDFWRGTFRVRGDVVEIFPVFSNSFAYRVDFDGDKIAGIFETSFLTGEIKEDRNKIYIFPATHYLAPREDLPIILETIRKDMVAQVKKFKSANKLIEAQRLEQRVKYDLEMIKETGFVSGIENYSRYFEQRNPGEPSYSLLDYFPKDFLMFIDESHITVPQIGGMYNGDQARKKNLVDYGWRLPAALDNRPLKFKEFDKKINQVCYVSATPRDYERKISKVIAEQIIRPTGLLDPEIEIRKTAGQLDDLIIEINKRAKKKQRTLITTLTKRMAEELTDYLEEKNIKVAYLHSDVDTLVRLEILRDLRLGKYDVLVGINLLREGLDLPEVSLVAILDAEKESFLRDNISLIQTMGRAARHVEGKVIMYADKTSGSMSAAITVVKRRRHLQKEYNLKNNITPQTIQKAISTDRLAGMKIEKDKSEFDQIIKRIKKLPKDERKHLLNDLEAQMKLAAVNLEFEKAANLRDQIKELKKLKK